MISWALGHIRPFAPSLNGCQMKAGVVIEHFWPFKMWRKRDKGVYLTKLWKWWIYSEYHAGGDQLRFTPHTTVCANFKWVPNESRSCNWTFLAGQKVAQTGLGCPLSHFWRKNDEYIANIMLEVISWDLHHIRPFAPTLNGCQMKVEVVIEHFWPGKKWRKRD